MSNTETQTWHTRRFRYDDKTFDTVPPTLSIEETRKMLAAYLPELANATHKEEIKDGVLTVTFHKQATTKGTTDSEATALIEALRELEGIDNPAERLYEIFEGEKITLELLAQHEKLLEAAACFIEGNLYLPKEMIGRCSSLAPIPARFVPIGF